ncbi:MAG: sulfatase [Opitutia bacterium]
MRPSLPALLLLAALASGGETRTNVLFSMADDLRAETGVGGLYPHTPNLTRLGAKATKFHAAHCQQAVCNPSRSSLLTGLRPDTIGLWNNSVHFRQLQPDVVTLPHRFKLSGYETRCVGKIFHNWHTAEKGDAQAWSAPEFLHYANHGDDTPKVAGDLPPNQVTGVPGVRKYGQVPMTECREVPDEAYYDGRVAAEAVRTLGEIKDRPFFLAVGFWKPHAPFNAPAKYWSLYRRAQFMDFDGRRPAGAPEQAFHESSEILGKGPAPTPEEAAEMRHGYFANLAYLDAQIGKLLDALDRTGVADRTAVVFVSDHGYHLGENSLWGKTSNFEFDARVPLMISLPGQRRGAATASFAELIDLYPTLLEVCDIPRKDRLDGTSLMPVLRDPAAKVKDAAFTQHPRPAYFDRAPGGRPTTMGYSVRTAAGRYTEWRDWTTGRPVAREFYVATSTVKSDEAVNRVDFPAHAAAVAEAEKALLAVHPRVGH